MLIANLDLEDGGSAFHDLRNLAVVLGTLRANRIMSVRIVINEKGESVFEVNMYSAHKEMPMVHSLTRNFGHMVRTQEGAMRFFEQIAALEDATLPHCSANRRSCCAKRTLSSVSGSSSRRPSST
ncbi:MAG: hypothetical protein ACYTBJ_14015 [Planctomycetota bacterium]|jgi:hypothetical protein